ncbi:multiprotein-bridging factor 1 family protein [Nocardia sp. NPDC020380]|uniref:multiprotein-bridging factor 1 family protein n=1 Tax=Nocardia sp. NPDC020380 TaxID=3364309 RepID=UPI00379BFE74
MVTWELQERFGRIVAERREELGLSRPDVRLAGGPSVATMARIENPQSNTAPPSPATLRQLDIGLRWTEGSAARALHGGDPMTLGEQPSVADARGSQPRGRGEHDPLDFRVVELDVELVDALIAAADRCFQLCDRADLPDAAREAAQAVKAQLGVAVGRLAAAQATEVLERAGGPGNALPTNIERLIGAVLATPPTATGAERENQQYRRWLAGTATDLDPILADTFSKRWRSKLNRISLIEGEGG